MIWLTWRQFRLHAYTSLGVVALIALCFAATGRQLAHLYATSGVPTCTVHGDCAALRTAFLAQVTANPTYVALYFAGIAALYLAPAIIGMFWGAPLVTRELEAGTFRLTFAQSVTRTRWLAVKVAVIALSAMAVSGLLSVATTWWASPIDQADAMPGTGQALPNRFVPLIFAARDIVPIGYAALGFALGVTVGILVRRTLPAMALTLVGIAAVQLLMPVAVRPHLIGPELSTVSFDSAAITRFTIVGTDRMTVTAQVNIAGAWIVSTETVDPSGRPFTGPVTAACRPETSPSLQACLDSIDELHLRQVVTYQPANRFWAFQWYETTILLAMAAALVGLSTWRIRRLPLS